MLPDSPGLLFRPVPRLRLAGLCFLSGLLAGSVPAADRAPSTITAPERPAAQSGIPRTMMRNPEQAQSPRGAAQDSRHLSSMVRYRSLSRADRERAMQNRYKEPEPESDRPVRDMVSEPWLSPGGERLVAVVEDRFLTRNELDLRVRLLLQNAPLIEETDPDRLAELEEDRRVGIAQKLLSDWVQTTALSIMAERSGFVVKEEEVEDALSELAHKSDSSRRGVRRQIKLVGVPEEKLHEEVRDSLLVERFIMKTVRDIPQRVYRTLYEERPGLFLIPPRHKVFHAYANLDMAMSARERKDISDRMKDIRKALSKRNPDYKALIALSDENMGLAVGEMGWIGADTPLAGDIKSQIFSLEPGGTSEVFQATRGLHVVRVLEREEGSDFTFDAAIPQIENYLFEKSKDAIYGVVKSSMEIKLNSGGLNRWREADPGEEDDGPSYEVASAPPPPPPPAEKKSEPEIPKLNEDFSPTIPVTTTAGGSPELPQAFDPAPLGGFEALDEDRTTPPVTPPELPPLPVSNPAVGAPPGGRASARVPGIDLGLLRDLEILPENARAYEVRRFWYSQAQPEP